MTSKPIENDAFKKKNRADSLNTVNTGKTDGVKIDDEIVSVDPRLLFQRLITAARGVV